MTSLILAAATLITIIGISIYAWRKGQSGPGVFFLLYSTISIIVHFVTADDSIKYDIMKIMPQIGVIVCAGGVIYAQATGRKKLLWAIPGLVIIGAVILLNLQTHAPDHKTVSTANSTEIK